MKLIIDVGLCTACKQCMQVCIRDNIVVEDFAVETGSNCFECGHCMAICRQNAITLKSYAGHEDRIVDYNPREIPIEYDDLLQFLKQRRSIRWFKNKKLIKKFFLNYLKELITLRLLKTNRMLNLLFLTKD